MEPIKNCFINGYFISKEFLGNFLIQFHDKYYLNNFYSIRSTELYFLGSSPKKKTHCMFLLLASSTSGKKYFKEVIWFIAKFKHCFVILPRKTFHSNEVYQDFHN